MTYEEQDRFNDWLDKDTAKGEEENNLYAYARGYCDGRMDGVPNEEWDNNHYYKRGYDRGVADYCEDMKNDVDKMEE